MNTGIGQGDPGWYEVRLQGRLDQRWSTWLDGMDVATDTDGTTVIHGHVADQAALHGLLTRLRDIGLPLISLNRLTPDRTPATTHLDDTPTGD